MFHLKIGDKAPEFIGVDQNGNQQTLIEYQGKKVVLFFYPKANTPGCITEACDLRDNYQYFLKQNYVLIGVSADEIKQQKKFEEKYLLPFPLLADVDRTIIETYGVWGLKKFMGREFDGIHRTTFVIDENGIIEDIIYKVKTKEHSDQILKQKV